jgi:hypothetical protein
MITPRELAERMKRDIVADVKARIVPATVASFSQLHDYVDANCYGGTEALLDELDALQPDTDEGHRAALDQVCDLCNPAMGIVDAWIKAGGIETALTLARLGATSRNMKITVYRPREADGLGPPQAFLGEDHPTEGDWVQSAKHEMREGEYRPLLMLGRTFLIYSMYHAREPRFMGYAIENFGAAVKKIGYALPLNEEDACWLPYGPEGFDPGSPEHLQFMLGQIATVFGTDAAKAQADALRIQWPSRLKDTTCRGQQI